MDAYAIIAIGASLGGSRALETLLAGLRADFPLPIALVQHRHKDRDRTLETLLGVYSGLPIREIEDKTVIRPGYVYLAPADYHVLVDSTNFALSIDAPVISARPSIDVLFESVADSYGPRAIGVILTGASHDGAAGLAAIKRCGGVAVVQDPACAECAVMPAAALAATPGARVLPLTQIAPFLESLCLDTNKE